MEKNMNCIKCISQIPRPNSTDRFCKFVTPTLTCKHLITASTEKEVPKPSTLNLLCGSSKQAHSPFTRQFPHKLEFNRAAVKPTRQRRRQSNLKMQNRRLTGKETPGGNGSAPNEDAWSASNLLEIIVGDGEEKYGESEA